MHRSLLPAVLLLTWTGLAAAARPNVIVLFTDDQGYADLSCQGQVEDIRTPHIDRLAAEGVRMTDGYVTAPQCVPSRAGLLTGRYQTEFGLEHNGQGPLPLEVSTVADRLTQSGYATGMVGKWHLEPNSSCIDWLREQFPDARDPRQVEVPARLMSRYAPAARGFTDFFHGYFSDYHGNYALTGASLAPQTVKTGLYRIDAQTEAVLAFIRRHRAEPFFLYVGYFAPHVPLEATPRYLNRFPGDMPERRRHALAMLSAVDDGTGRILDELQAQGLDEQTLVFYISDNGAPLKIDKEDLPISFRGGAWDGSLNDPLVGEKGMLTEGGIRVPFLMRWKGTLPAGQIYTRPVTSLDVAATALALASAEVPGELDGVNLIPYLTGADDRDPHPVLYWRFWNQAAVRAGRWKYLHLGDGSEYLFDLSSAEHEHRNRVEDHRAIADSLRQQLSDWGSEQQPPGLPANGLNEQEVPWYTHYLGWQAKVE